MLGCCKISITNFSCIFQTYNYMCRYLEVWFSNIWGLRHNICKHCLRLKSKRAKKTQGNGDYAIYSITCTISKSRVWGFVTSEQTVVSLILTDHSPRCHPWMGFGVLQHQPLIGVRRTIMLLRWSRNSVSLRTHQFIEIY